MPVFLLVALLVSTAAYAQVQSRPTDPPLVSAAGESWYQLREPMLLGADVYYHAGAAVFFNGNVMVRTGHYNGVPLYADATMEPYSVLYVPIGRGQMQPSERKRQGPLAGMAGSRLSGFPLRLLGDPGAIVTATATAPTQLPFTAGAIVSYTPETISFSPTPLPVPVPIAAAAPVVVAAAVDVAPPPVFVAKIILSPTVPENNDGVWVQFDNARWVSSGRAEAQTGAFTQVGTHGGFPVLRRPGGPSDQIFIPTRDGLVAPYRRKG
jgi:hypothetical protein